MSFLPKRRAPAQLAIPASALSATEEVTHQLREAEIERGRLELAYAEAALANVVGDAASAKKLAAAAKHLEEARRRVAGLEAALLLSKQRDQAAERAERAELQKSHVLSVRQHLAARDKAVSRLSKAAEEVCAAFREVIVHSERAVAANPRGGTWPIGSMCEFDDLLIAVRGELYRLGGDERIGGRLTFPGGQPPSSDYTHNPRAIPPLAEQATAATARVISVLTGRITE
jgi:hypothetical protein